MSKDSVSALIRSIQETTKIFISSGVYFRNKLITNNADSDYLESLECSFSGEIDVIINNIPDDPEPPPVPPKPENSPGYYVIDNSTGEILLSSTSEFIYGKPTLSVISGTIIHVDNPQSDK